MIYGNPLRISPKMPLLESLNVSENGTYTPEDGSAYYEVLVQVPQLSPASLSVKSNGVYIPNEGQAYTEVEVSVPTPTLVPLTATENAVYQPETGKAYSKVTVNVSAGGGGGGRFFLEHDFDLTQGLLDSVENAQVTINGCVQDQNGVHFSGERQYLSFTHILQPERTYVINISTMDLQGDDANDYALLTFGTNSALVGLVYRSSVKEWLFRSSNTSMSSSINSVLAGESAKNYWDKKELGLYFHLGRVYLYADGELLGVSSKGFSSSINGMHIGVNYDVTKGGQLQNTTITRLRSYFGEYYSETEKILLKHDFRFTIDLQDKVDDTFVATISGGCVQDEDGIHFSAARQSVSLGPILSDHYSYIIDIPSMNLSGKDTYNYAFLLFGSASSNHRFVFTTGKKWQFLMSSAVSGTLSTLLQGEESKNYWNGKQLGFYIRDGNFLLYSKNPEDLNWLFLGRSDDYLQLNNMELCIGSTVTATSGGQIYNMTVSRVRAYHGNIFEAS